MKYLLPFVLVIPAVLTACGGTQPAEVPGTKISGAEVIGEWSDEEGNRVCTLFAASTDRESVSRFARRFPNPDNDALILEFYSDRDQTPDLSDLTTLDEVLNACNAPELDSVHVGSFDASANTLTFNPALE